MRSGTLPAAVYAAIKDGDGEATMEDIASVIAEEKDKDVSKCYGIANRTIARKIGKHVAITVTYGGADETEAVVALAEDDDE